MLETVWFREALEFAKILHHGQVDKAGAPYWMHLERVARRLVERFPDATKAQLQAALLHDAIEDAGVTADNLRGAGIEEDAIAAIQLVSRNLDPDGPYLDWIRRIVASGNVTAIRVKLADNLDNSDPVRVAALAAGPGWSPRNTHRQGRSWSRRCSRAVRTLSRKGRYGHLVGADDGWTNKLGYL